MATSPQEIHRINYLLDKIDDLSEWEQEFINSIAEYPCDRTLSANERIKLNEIYAKY